MRERYPQTKPNYQDFLDTAWARGVFRPFLIALLSASLFAGPIAVMRAIWPWRLGYALPLAFLAALEGVYSTRQLGKPTWRDRRGLLFRLGEVAFLLIVLRLVVWAFSTGWPSTEDLRLWLRTPGAFFDTEFTLVSVLILGAWSLAISTTGDFLALAIQADEAAARESHLFGADTSQLRVFHPLSRTAIMRRLAIRWGWGGFSVVFFAAVSRVSLLTGAGASSLKFGLTHLGLSRDVLIALLCYFLAGLILLSQARLAVLRGHWFNQQVDILPNVLDRWHINSLLILLLIAGLAALLPFGSTSWLATMLSTAIAFLMRAIYAFLVAFLSLLSLMLYPLRYLFSLSSTEGPTVTQKLKIPTQAEAVRGLPDWLGGTVLWGAVILISSYLVLSYLSAHGVFKGGWTRLFDRLRFWWYARWSRIRAVADGATATLRRRWALPYGAQDRIRPPRGIRLSALDSREKIRYFYLRAVRRAADRGLRRPKHKTPLEFAHDLEHAWPEAELDLQTLTEAFLIARYDRRVILGDEARSIRGIWRRVMRTLRSGGEQHGRHFLQRGDRQRR